MACFAEWPKVALIALARAFEPSMMKGAVRRVEPTFDEVVDQGLHGRRVFPRTLDQSERMPVAALGAAATRVMSSSI